MRLWYWRRVLRYRARRLKPGMPVQPHVHAAARRVGELRTRKEQR